MPKQINNYDIFTGDDLIIADKILQRRLQMLVHSCIYYELDFNIISDMKWDNWAKELVQLQHDYPNISEQVMWYEAFKDWDASTGAFLPIRDPWVINRAQVLSGMMGHITKVASKKTMSEKVTKSKKSTKSKKLF